MQVRELMTEQVVAIDVKATLWQAAGRMLSANVGSIIVVDDGSPIGLVTKSDVLEAGVVAEKPFRRVPLANVMSRPVVTVRPTATVQDAVELMDDHAVKHLPVATDAELHGIITSSDIVYHHDELLSEVEALQRESGDRLAADAAPTFENETQSNF